MDAASGGFWTSASASVCAVGLDFGSRIFTVSWRLLDHLKLDLLNFFNTASQRFTEERPTPIDFPQAGVAAVLGHARQAINLLDGIESAAHPLSHEAINVLARRGEKLIHKFDGVRFMA